MLAQIWLIPLFPLLGCLFNGLFGKLFGKQFVTIVGILSILFAFGQAATVFFQMLSLDEQSIHQVLYTWIAIGDLEANIAFHVDPLSGLFILIITGIGLLIHVYSVGYMWTEDGYYRYFSYLNLFVFFMLLLVLGDNFLLLFIGWEGVGLCSYLLIGYYFEKHSAAKACKKAFLLNRIGDFGVVSAVLLLFFHLGTIEFAQVNAEAIDQFTEGGVIVTVITLLLFLGAAGKSAQIPLYVWLPDAMEGPTPVSALIHAATMVTAGLYMIARLSHLFVLAPLTMNLIAMIGAFTALMAATIAITQTDIKKVLAYSTVSQLGYMFLAMGVGAFGAGIFHVMTHAFFKALLFLGAGSVIHALHHEQDMMKMGGLAKKLPYTYGTMLIGTLAITGIPFFAGFFSKDEILWFTYASATGGFGLWLVGLVTAGLTSFYMFRLLYLTFHGKSRLDAHTTAHVHESPKSMIVPLLILAVLSTFGGFFGVPHVLHILPHGLEYYFQGFFAEISFSGSTKEELTLMVISVLLAVGAWYVVHFIYRNGIEKAEKLKKQHETWYQFSLNKWYVDEIYTAVIIQPLQRWASQFLWKRVDLNIIDAFVRLSVQITQNLGTLLRPLQNGIVQNYATIFSVGTFLILLYVFLMN